MTVPNTREKEMDLNLDQLDMTGFWTHLDDQTTTNQKIISLSKQGPLDEFLALIESASYASSSTTIDFNIMDNNGWSPLTHSAFNGHFEIMQNIIAFQEQKYRRELGEQREAVEHQQDVPSNQESGSASPAEGGLLWKESMRKFLCSKLSYNGSTALHLACARGHERIAKLLLNKMINEYKIPPSESIDAVDYDLATPLHCSVLGKHHSMMVLLLMNGAVINKCDRHGKSPVDWAVERKLQHFLAMFKQYEQSNMSTCSAPPAQDREHKAAVQKGVAQSVGDIWEEQDYKSREVSLDDLLIGEAPLFPDVEEELLPFRADFGGRNEHNGTNEWGYYGHGQHHGFGVPFHDQKQQAFAPNNGWSAHHGVHGQNGHHQAPLYQNQQVHGGRRRGHHEQTLSFRESAPRHVRYNNRHHGQSQDYYARSAPPPSDFDSSSQTAVCFEKQPPNMYVIARDDYHSVPLAEQRNVAQRRNDVDIAAESVQMALNMDMQMVAPSQSSPQSPTKKLRRARVGFEDELDIKGLDINGLDINGMCTPSIPTDSESESVWKSRHDALQREIENERRKWHSAQQTKTKLLEKKQSQIHDLRHRLRKMSRFLDDLPNAIKMRFYKNKANFCPKADAEDGCSVGSTSTKPAETKKRKRMRKVGPVGHTPIPKGVGGKKKKCRSKMVKVVGRTSRGIKRKNTSAG